MLRMGLLRRGLLEGSFLGIIPILMMKMFLRVYLVLSREQVMKCLQLEDLLKFVTGNQLQLPLPIPFAGIRLIAPNESSSKPAEASTGVPSASEKIDATDGKGSEDALKEEVKNNQADSKTNEVVNESIAVKDDSGRDQTNVDTEINEKKEIEGNDGIVDKEVKNEVRTEKEPADNGSDGNVIKEDDKDKEGQSSDGATLRSFQQMSSNQNAFTGLAGTRFSPATFSFGSFSNEGSSLGAASSSIFGMKTDIPFGLVGLSTNGSSSTISKGDVSGLPAMQEVSVETEEQERTVFTADSVLFEFVDKGWKERGKGEVKVNVTTTGSETARLLMRAKGNYRLILNARIYADMKLTNMDKRGITFACINSATEEKGGLSTFALKFRDASVVEEFRAAVMEHKGQAAAVLKTPENSPKYSND